MHFRSRVFIATIHELNFADDCAHNTTTEEDMKMSMDLFAATCESIARRLWNQCLGLQNTVATPASTALTALAPS
ncbi:unnamed protein product [Schistocephalus solidus]|uniref:Uncharacterized protein n=1 Tax=Schistocephalus solidus TaxID=70667 RepID=A0A183SIN0_SCHSO|nr:unnamed protein product [Schistocephalus solidus]